MFLFVQLKYLLKRDQRGVVLSERGIEGLGTGLVRRMGLIEWSDIIVNSFDKYQVQQQHGEDHCPDILVVDPGQMKLLRIFTIISPNRNQYFARLGSNIGDNI